MACPLTFSSPHRTYSCLLGLVVACAASSTFVAAAAEPNDNPPVIELPKFVVTDSRALPPPESWRHASIPGFEILSNASDGTTRRLLNDFQLFQQALSIVWPMPAKFGPPVLLILCGRGNQFEAFLPNDRAGSPEMARASVYLRGERQSAIVIDVESTVINVTGGGGDDPPGVDDTRFAIDHNKQLYREYVRYLLSQCDPRLPVWFEEGMSQVVMAMQFDAKWIEFGKIDDEPRGSALAGNRPTTSFADPSDDSGSDTPTNQEPVLANPVEDRDFNAALAQKALIPFDKFFAVSRDAPEALNPLGNNVWSKQAYAFVHLGLFGEKGHWRSAFSEFLLRSTQEPVTENLFKQCFKMSYREMAMELRGYIQYTTYRSQEFRAKKGAGPLLHPAKLELHDATPAETGRIKGEAKLLAGHTEAARTELVAPYIRGDRDPQLLAALGEEEASYGKSDRARKFLEAAVAARTTDAEAYRALARFALADALRGQPVADAQMPRDTVASILHYLNQARTHPPPDLETYALLAQTWLHSATPPNHDDVAPLIEGVRLFPQSLQLVYDTATLCVRARLTDAAQSLVTYGEKIAPDPMSREKFVRVAATLPPMTPTPPPAVAKP